MRYTTTRGDIAEVNIQTDSYARAKEVVINRANFKKLIKMGETK